MSNPIAGDKMHYENLKASVILLARVYHEEDIRVAYAKWHATRCVQNVIVINL